MIGLTPKQLAYSLELPVGEPERAVDRLFFDLGQRVSVYPRAWMRPRLKRFARRIRSAVRRLIDATFSSEHFSSRPPPSHPPAGWLQNTVAWN